MEMITSAELFSKKKHLGMMRKDGMTLYVKHLEGVVSRLKSIGIVDKELLCVGWLHDTIEDTDTSFEEILEKFGNRIAVLVLDLSKDMSLSRKQREKEYIKKLKESSEDAKIIKLCDISTNLSDLKNSKTSKTKKLRNVRQIRHYVTAIKNDIITSTNYPKSIALLESVNQNLKYFNQRNIKPQSVDNV